MKVKLSVRQMLLLLSCALFIPCFVFTVVNCCVSPWPLYDRNRLALCILTPLFTAALWWIQRQISRQHVRLPGWALPLFAFLVLCIQIPCALALRHTPFTDAEQVVTAASNLAATGAFEQSERSFIYFSRYPFNLGSVYLFAAVLRPLYALGITDTYAALAVMSAVLFAAGLCCGVQCARKLGGDSSAVMFLVLCALCFPFYYCTAELYTDVIALPFGPAILYTYLRAREPDSRRIPWILSFACLSFAGSALRVTVLIISIACLITALLSERVRFFLPLLLCTVLAVGLGNAVLEKKHEQHLGAENLRVHRLSVWHYLAMGLPAQEDDGYGQYGDGGWLIFSTSFEDPEERDAQLREHVRNRLYRVRYPSRLLNMLSRKNLSTFGDGTFHLNQLIEADEPEPDNLLKQIIYSGGIGYRIYFTLCSALFYAQMLLASIRCLGLLRKRETEEAPLFLACIGAFIYLSVWETNARYFFMFQFLLLLACTLNPAQNRDGKNERIQSV